jgi:hypothetical protein
MEKNKTGKYLKYAIGEIILVVIGILIAISINNWNQNRNKKNQLDNIYLIVDKDLRADLINIDIAINFYEGLEIKLDEILTTKYPTSFSDSINETNFSDCMPCTSHIAFFYSFFMQDKGVELLKKYDENKSIGINDLSQEVIQLHTVSRPRLIKTLESVSSEAYNNLKYFEQFPWYSDYRAEKYNPEAVLFFTQNQNYKNKAVTFKQIAVGNYLKFLREYKKGASDMIEKIERRQEKK